MDINGKENDEILFKCQVNKAGLKPKWLKDGREVSSEGRFEVETRGENYFLRISNICLEDEGRYSCTVRNLRTDGKLFVEGSYNKAIKLYS